MLSSLQGARTSRALGAAALFALLAFAYAFSIDLRATRGASITGDEPFYLLTTQSLIEDGDLDLRNQYVAQSYRAFFDHDQPLWMQSTPLPDGRILSPHEPGLSVYLIPGFALGGLRGAQVQMLLTAAAAFALAFVLIASQTQDAAVNQQSHGATRTALAWLATLGVGLTATAFVYATELYPEVPAGLCLVLALLVLRRSPTTVGDAVAVAVLVTALAWLGTKYIPLGVLIALAGLWRGDRTVRGWLAGLSAASGAFYVAWHLEVFGGLTAYSTNAVYSGTSTLEVIREHLAIPDRAYRLLGLFVDQRFGLGRWSPLLLLVLPALPLLLRRGPLGTLAAALVLAQLLIATLVAITMMGWWFPGRTLVTVLPLIAWIVTEALLRLPAPARVAVGGLGVYSVLVTVALASAVRAGAVTIAVDPFELSSIVFRAPTLLFPDYRAWGIATTVLHGAWAAAALGGHVLAVRGERDARWMSAGIEAWARTTGSVTKAAASRAQSAPQREVRG